LIQACEVAGVEIPRFCYHERLSIAGNCRMCLVEIVGGPPKPAASCAMQVRDLRPGKDGAPPEVLTKSPMVKKAREGVMEFLLINHPLDCPICDQGGECDLQDQAMAYGVDFSRYREPKRAAEDLQLGPLVGTHMTRCISCTRCVRFITEVAGVAEMGQIGRGEDSEITNYLGRILESEMQGNIVDLCPVGALTNKPYAFTARPWELRKTESIDVMDALGSNIRVDTRGREVMRILPRNHDDINEEWISDKTRHVVDGLRRQRLDRPYIREKGKLRPATWPEAMALVAKKLKAAKGKVAAVAGDLAPVEAMWALKGLMESLGSTAYDCRQDGAKLPRDNRSAWLFGSTIAGVDAAKAILLIGSNPRVEAPVLNARIRKAWSNGADVAMIGEPADLTYPVEALGAGGDTLKGVAASAWGEKLRDGGVVILGAGPLAREDGAAILGAAMALAAETGAAFSVLHTAASRVGGMEIGFSCDAGAAGAIDAADVVYLLGADEIETPKAKFVIYQGHHGDRGAHRADVILPGAAYTEQSGLFVNMEGRPQLALRCGFPPGEAKEDWAIIRALSGQLGQPLPFDTLDALRAAVFKAHPHLGMIDAVDPAELRPEPGGSIAPGAFATAITDHFLTNPVARASAVMAELSKLAAARGRAVAAE
ncbi:MAG: NADH-quinone oxidoreductase subunit G, partial [Rhodobacteraceae bacterium]